jgi:hypothetical protein
MAHYFVAVRTVRPALSHSAMSRSWAAKKPIKVNGQFSEENIH